MTELIHTPGRVLREREWPDARIKKLRRLMASGKSLARVGFEMGISAAGVHYAVTRLEIKPGARESKRMRLNGSLALYEAGYRVEDIHEAAGHTCKLKSLMVMLSDRAAPSVRSHKRDPKKMHPQRMERLKAIFAGDPREIRRAIENELSRNPT